MTLVQATNERDAAWSNYASTVRSGGTREQRLFAFEKAKRREREYARQLVAQDTDRAKFRKRYATHA